jgi:hypothetical protein
MIRQAIAFLLVSSWTASASAEPKVTFVRSETTKKHIAVQPKEEHHRIYFPLRIEGAAGKTAYAQVRCQPKTGPETVQTVRFEVAGKSELWTVYLRAPRHDTQHATYQVEVGIYDSRELDPKQTLGQFGWIVGRSGGKASFITSQKQDGRDVAVSLPIPRRVAKVVGEKIEIVTVPTYGAGPEPEGVIFGLDNSLGAGIIVTGSGASRVSE